MDTREEEGFPKIQSTSGWDADDDDMGFPNHNPKRCGPEYHNFKVRLLHLDAF